MISRNSFLISMRENLKRRMWYPLVLALVQMFEYPVLVAMRLSDVDETRNGIMPIMTDAMVFRRLNRFLGVSTAPLLLALLFGALAALQGFSYLNSRRKVDLYHSVPVSKSQRFWVICANSVAMYAVIHLASVLAGLGMAAAFGYMTPTFFGWAMLDTAFNLIGFLTGFSVTLVAVMLTGNLIVTVLGTAVIALYEPMLRALLDAHLNTFYKHYSLWGHNGFLDSSLWVSPVVVWGQFVGEVSWLGAESVEKLGILGTAFGEQRAASLVKVLLEIAAFLAVGYVLYRRRSSEAAGKAIAYPKIKQPLKVLMLVPISLFVGVLFYDAVGGDHMGFEVFGLLAGLLLGHSIIEMIYEFDLKAPLRHLKALGVSAAMTAFIVSVFVFDLFGYDKYVPNPDKLEYAAIYVSGMQQGDFYKFGENGVEFSSSAGTILEKMQLRDVQLVCEIGEAGMKNEKGSRSFDVRYHLKNGRDVYRAGYLDVDADARLLERLVTDSDYVAAAYQVNFEEFPGMLGNMTWGYRNAVYAFPETRTDVRELYDAFRPEFNGRSYGMICDEVPIGEVTFNLPIEYPSGGKRIFTWSYPVYREFTHTLDFLEAHGVAAEDVLEASGVESISISGPTVNLDEVERSDYYRGYEYTWEDWEFTEPAEIEEIVPYLLSAPLINWSVNVKNSRYSADVMLKDGVYVHCYFESGRLPQVLLSKLEDYE